MKKITLIVAIIFLQGCFNSNSSKAENKTNSITSSASSTKTTGKIKLPKSIKFGMSVEEVLKINPCDLKNEKISLKSNVVTLMCPLLPPEIKFETVSSLDVITNIAQFYFVNNKLRTVNTLITKNINYFENLIKTLKTILGPTEAGVSQDDINKFNANITPALFVGWKDGNQFVVVQAKNHNHSHQVWLNIFPDDFDWVNEIGD